MKVNSTGFAAALAITTVILWLGCSLLVWFSPEMMMSMTGHMIHLDLSEFGWQLTASGVFFGLVSWTLIAAISGWLIAAIYNRIAIGNDD